MILIVGTDPFRKVLDKPVYQAIWADNTRHYNEILISPVMMNDHWPNRLMNSLNMLANTHQTGPAKPHRSIPPTPKSAVTNESLKGASSSNLLSSININQVTPLLRSLNPLNQCSTRGGSPEGSTSDSFRSSILRPTPNHQIIGSRLGDPRPYGLSMTSLNADPTDNNNVATNVDNNQGILHCSPIRLAEELADELDAQKTASLPCSISEEQRSKLIQALRKSGKGDLSKVQDWLGKAPLASPETISETSSVVADVSQNGGRPTSLSRTPSKESYRGKIKGTKGPITNGSKSNSDHNALEKHDSIPEDEAIECENIKPPSDDTDEDGEQLTGSSAKEKSATSTVQDEGERRRVNEHHPLIQSSQNDQGSSFSLSKKVKFELPLANLVSHRTRSHSFGRESDSDSFGCEAPEFRRHPNDNELEREESALYHSSSDTELEKNSQAETLSHSLSHHGSLRRANNEEDRLHSLKDETEVFQVDGDSAIATSASSTSTVPHNGGDDTHVQFIHREKMNLQQQNDELTKFFLSSQLSPTSQLLMSKLLSIESPADSPQVDSPTHRHRHHTLGISNHLSANDCDGDNSRRIEFSTSPSTAVSFTESSL